MYFIIVDLISELAQNNSKILDPAKSKELLSYFISEKGLKASYLGVNIKDSILNMLNVISSHKRTFFTKNKDLVEKLMVIMVEFMLASKRLGPYDEEEAALGYSCIRLFEILAENLPKKLLKPILQKILGELYKSKEQRQLIAMYFIYSAVANGLQDVLKPELANLMKEEISFGINHQSPQVKNAAIRTVSYFSEFLLPNILEYTSIVIPALVCAMDSDDIDLVEHAIFVLDVFTEYLEEDQIKEYLPVLVPKVITMISHPKASYKVRKFAIDALCSLVNAGDSSFTPYLDQSYTILNEIINCKNDEIKLVHGTAYSCMGKILSIVCKTDKSHFGSKFLATHNSVVADVKNESNNFDLMEGCYTFMYQAAETLGEEYGKVSLENAFPLAKNMIEKENIVRKASEDALDLDDDEKEGADFILVNLDEAKSAALHWIGSCAEFAPFAFQPFEAEAVTLLDGCMSFEERESTSTRQQSLVALKGILISKIKRNHHGLIPPFKKSWDTPQLPQEVMDFFSSQYYMKTEFYISNEDDKEAVCLMIEAFRDCLKLTGPAVLRNETDHLIKLIQAICSFDIVCFDKGDEDDEDQESDGKIFMSLVDLIVILAEILTTDAFGLLSEIIPGLFALVEKGNVFELDEFLGGYCDIIKACPQIMTKDTDIVTDMIYESPSLEDSGPVRNACFLLGIMHETNPACMERFIEKSLGFYLKVHQTFSEPEVKDNVVAGIIRIYTVDTKGLVPEEKVRKVYKAYRDCFVLVSLQRR